MQFEWDAAKNQSSIEKHGVSFETAARIFEGPHFTWIDDRRAYGEPRLISIGMAAGTAVLTVAHTERAGRIRLISARPASRRERVKYHEQVSQAFDSGRDRGSR